MTTRSTRKFIYGISIYSLFITSLVLIFSCSGRPDVKQPLSLLPQNSHYFLFRGKPTVLIGSTEHYGAVMNLDFDYNIYLKELAANGLNVTRTFSGAYVEPGSAFGIKENTLAPFEGRYVCPWARSSETGYIGGGNKFDLSTWDAGYFKRLKDFINTAGNMGIVVELDLFSNYYDTIQWKLSPLNGLNNINRVGEFADHKEVLSLRHDDLLRVQEEMVRKIVHELKDCDNLYYEVCNEPYFGDTIALGEWEHHMTEVVLEAEKDFEFHHLVSNNVANNHKLVAEPRRGVSIYNFHYAHPPLTVGMNYKLNSVIGDNETGFDGVEDSKYRSEAWNFILAGGGLFNNLDYSFTIGTEDGTTPIGKDQPGGGGRKLRSQLKILTEYIGSMDFYKMKPVDEGLFISADSSRTTIHALALGSDLIAAYIHRNDTGSIAAVIKPTMDEGEYKLEWTDTKTGARSMQTMKNAKAGCVKIDTPPFSEDIALKLIKVK
jgi:hypothetical protein